MLPLFLLALTCTAIDGDTIRCGTAERLRLLGIDAPERHCPKRRRCAPGDWQASRDALAAGLRLGAVRIAWPGKRDRYGRPLIHVWAGRQNLSCRQLQLRQAIYRADWDDGKRLARLCPRLAH